MTKTVRVVAARLALSFAVLTLMRIASSALLPGGIHGEWAREGGIVWGVAFANLWRWSLDY